MAKRKRPKVLGFKKGQVGIPGVNILPFPEPKQQQVAQKPPEIDTSIIPTAQGDTQTFGRAFSGRDESTTPTEQGDVQTFGQSFGGPQQGIQGTITPSGSTGIQTQDELNRNRGILRFQMQGMSEEEAKAAFEEELKNRVPRKKDTGALPTATVATKDKPIIERGAVDTSIIPTEQGDIQTFGQAFGTKEETAPTPGGVDEVGGVDLRTTKIGEVLSENERRQLVDQEKNRIRTLEGVSFDERNKMFRKLNDDVKSGAFFGGETQLESERIRAEADKRRIEQQTGEALTKAEDVFKQDLERQTARIREKGQKVLDTTQRLNSLRGAGRGSVNEKAINEQQTQINDLISTAEANADIRLRKRQMEIEGASAGAISSINEALASNEAVLNQRIAEAITKQKELDAVIEADITESAENVSSILEAGGADVTGIDLKTTQDSGVNYFLKANGELWINPKTGKPEVFKKNEFAQDVKISQFKDANDNTYVYANGALDRIITTNGEILTGDQLDTVKVPAQIKEDKTTEERRGLETQLRKEFITRPETKRFLEIRASFERVKQGSQAKTAAGDLAMIFAFMKMLDPGSVVRESEFATAQNAAGVPERVRNLFNRAQTGERLGEKQRKDFFDRGKNLFDSERKIFDDVSTNFKKIIEDAGGRPDFVLVGEEIKGIQPVELDQQGTSQLDNIFGTTTQTTPTTTNTKSFKVGGRDFNINFKQPDQTGSIKGIKELGKVTQDFGATSPLKIDNVKLADGSVGTPGLDIDGNIGDPIPSTIAGTVKIVKSKTGLGNRVIVTDNQGNEHFFNHLQAFNVKDGQTINKGQKIGTMGNTGNVIPGPGGDGSHLDYRVKTSKGWVDPKQFLNS